MTSSKAVDERIADALERIASAEERIAEALTAAQRGKPLAIAVHGLIEQRRDRGE
jgi:hypothetical protein